MAAEELFTTPLFTNANFRAYFRMEGNANDSKGTNHGTAANVTFSSGNGKFGQGAGFNGSSSTFSAPTPITSTDSFALSLWFRSGGNTGVNIFENQLASDIALEGSDTGYTFYINNVAIGNTGAISTGILYHLACVWNEATGIGSLYLNGSFINSASSATSNNLTTLYLGHRNFGGASRFFNGAIDDVALLDRVLTAQEVSNISKGFPKGSFLLGLI
jgi:hypothetical protein